MSNYLVNGVDLDSIFVARAGGAMSANTNYLSAGTDLNNRYLKFTLGSNKYGLTYLKSSGVDLNEIFASQTAVLPTNPKPTGAYSYGTNVYNGVTYWTYIFTGAGTLTMGKITSQNDFIRFFMVAGGAGTNTSNSFKAFGCAGGNITESSFTALTGGLYHIDIGAGGNSTVNNGTGGDTSITMSNMAILSINVTGGYNDGSNYIYSKGNDKLNDVFYYPPEGSNVTWNGGGGGASSASNGGNSNEEGNAITSFAYVRGGAGSIGSRIQTIYGYINTSYYGTGGAGCSYYVKPDTTIVLSSYNGATVTDGAASNTNANFYGGGAGGCIGSTTLNGYSGICIIQGVLV
jgi:hypothetical protein